MGFFPQGHHRPNTLRINPSMRSPIYNTASEQDANATGAPLARMRNWFWPVPAGALAHRGGDDGSAIGAGTGARDRAAIVIYGIGLLPIIVLPVAYALTFDTQTLSAEDVEQVRMLGRRYQSRNEGTPGTSPTDLTA